MELHDKKQNKFQTFSCSDTKVTFDTNGYIINAKGFTSVMWSTQNIDEKLIGKHIIELAKLLKIYAANQEIYFSFLENVVLKFYERKTESNINEVCSIESEYTDISRTVLKKIKK